MPVRCGATLVKGIPLGEGNLSRFAIGFGESDAALLKG